MQLAPHGARAVALARGGVAGAAGVAVAAAGGAGGGVLVASAGRRAPRTGAKSRSAGPRHQQARRLHHPRRGAATHEPLSAAKRSATGVRVKTKREGVSASYAPPPNEPGQQAE